MADHEVNVTTRSKTRSSSSTYKIKPVKVNPKTKHTIVDKPRSKKHRHNIVVKPKNFKKFSDWNWTPVVNLVVQGKKLTAPIDSGASHSLISMKDINVETIGTKSTTVKSIWKTCGSSTCLTESKTKLDFKLPEFTSTRKVTWDFYGTKDSKSLNGYDCIIG